VSRENTHKSDQGPTFLLDVETKDVKLLGSVAPGVYAYGQVRPMGRIRAYSAAGLTPFAGRGAPSEFHLLGHVHVDAGGKASRVEGFNGAEGERWAKAAKEKLTSTGMLAEGATVQPLTPLRTCAHTGVR
jgi:hypothetical protein